MGGGRGKPRGEWGEAGSPGAWRERRGTQGHRGRGGEPREGKSRGPSLGGWGTMLTGAALPQLLHLETVDLFATFRLQLERRQLSF